mmetsp:Transcript_9976/g.16561  ORF Transcript_9976/g.16561 Transcript_9976/m.16561 type:complete len:237 (+) Transcript_9976:107-817(+)
MRRKRRNGSNTTPDLILDLGLDSWVRVNGLENATLQVQVSTHSAGHTVKVLAKRNNSKNGKEDVEDSEVDKCLRLPFNLRGPSLNDNTLGGLGILQSLSTWWRDSALFERTHQAMVTLASERKREAWSLELVWAHLCQATSHADTVLVENLRLEKLVPMLDNMLGDNFRLLCAAFHESVNHRVENLLGGRKLLWLLLRLLLRLLFRLIRNAIEADDGSLLWLLQESLGHHLVQNVA